MISQGFLRFRILVIFFIGILFFSIITIRSLQLQLIPNAKLSQLAKRQYQTAVTLFAKRGTIYDRNMNELAMSRKVGSIFANPKKIKQKAQVSLKLSRLTGVSSLEIFKKLKAKKSFVWISRLVDDSISEKLEKHPIDGVGLVHEYKRFYHNQELGGQVLGVVGVDSQGMEGIEYAYDSFLQGKNKSFALLRDALGRVVSMDETLIMESREGHSLVLTIDKTLQFLAEQELELQVQKFSAKQGLAIIQNVRTGEILAMAHYPFFNPNRFKQYPQSLWRNRAVQETFEPGSTFKIFLAARALEKGFSPFDKFYCENGLFKLNYKDKIREAEQHKYKWLTFQDILKFSSNIGAAKIGLKLGKKSFYQKINDFGFGQKTGIDITGESPGIVRSVEDWGTVELSNISFGQGIGVSAIQLVSAMSAIANDGEYKTPFVVKKIIDAETGSITEKNSPILKKVISRQVSDQLTRMLIRATQKDGTGFMATLENVSIAGKTGTAQKPNPKGRGYLSDKFIASFLGFFPAQAKDTEPKYTILVIIDEPKKHQFASIVAAPLFKTLAMHVLRLFPLNKERKLDQNMVLH